MSGRFRGLSFRDTAIAANSLSLSGLARLLGQDRSCRVFNSAAISLTSGVDTTLTFDSERWDTDTMHSTSSNTSRLIAKTSGKYFILANVAFAANVTGIRQLRLQVNGAGASVIAGCYVPAVSLAVDHRLVLATYYNMVANDYAEVIALQNSGGALDILVNSQETPEFMMIKFPF